MGHDLAMRAGCLQALDRVVVLDTETGGLDPFEHSLLSIGLVSGDGRREAEILVAEPELRITERSQEIHGLCPERLRAEGVSPAQACDRIQAFLSAGPDTITIAGHNIHFDVAFLRRLYRLAGRPFPEDLGHRTLDTHTLLWGLVIAGRLPAGTTSSDAAFAHFGISPPEAMRHTALGDARATHMLLRRLLELLCAPS